MCRFLSDVLLFLAAPSFTVGFTGRACWETALGLAFAGGELHVHVTLSPGTLPWHRACGMLSSALQSHLRNVSSKLPQLVTRRLPSRAGGNTRVSEVHDW